VGVLRRAKGIYELLEAFAAISNEFPDCGLFIVGEGEERTSLVQQCFAFGLMPRIIFTGYRSDSRALLKLCDACVLASHTEHYPLVLLEAMAEGVPVIATSVGAVPEMLGDGERGTLVPPKDIPALSDAMRIVLSSKDETHESVEKARQFVRETSSPAQFREGLKTFYHRWLEGEETIRADRD
jgi:glycosyltransferase involved in cell wall biosynthesis